MTSTTTAHFIDDAPDPLDDLTYSHISDDDKALAHRFNLVWPDTTVAEINRVLDEMTDDQREALAVLVNSATVGPTGDGRIFHHTSLAFPCST